MYVNEFKSMQIIRLNRAAVVKKVFLHSIPMLQGHVTSYYGTEMSKYTSFQVHMTEEIRCILPIEDGILILSPSTLRYQMRRGIPLYTHWLVRNC